MDTWGRCQVIRELSGQGLMLKDLLAVSGVPESTYHYNREKPPKPPTRPELWDKVVEVFSRTPNGCGHRQIAMCLRAEDGVTIADKTVLEMMHEIGISCGIRRETDYHRYSSYRGVVGKTFENVLGRDFAAEEPWQKMGTDVTEFKQPWGKAYLAPALDFCSCEIVSYSISRHPNLVQQAEMLDGLIAKKPEGKSPVICNDMGWQYQHERYWGPLERAGFVQSMSRKGNCLDNACTEGLFGHIKDEFFRGQTWPDFESFKADLEAYIVHWNTVRRQKRLGGLTPVEYRNMILEKGGTVAKL